MSEAEQPTRVRGRPFKRKGDEWSDESRVGSASDQTRAAGELAEVAAVDFEVFAARLLTDPGVRRAMTRRFKRGEISAAELRLVTDAAAKAPQTTDRQRSYAEEMARQQRLSKGERKLLYLLTKRMAGEDVACSVPGYAWRMVRVAGETAGASLPRVTFVYERPDEPELPETLPLAEASRRLRELPEATLIPTPEQALRRLTEGARDRVGLPPESDTRAAHDVEDERHRAVCRDCRRAWRDRP